MALILLERNNMWQVKTLKAALFGAMSLFVMANAQAKMAEVMENISPEEVLNIAKGFGSAELKDGSFIIGRMNGNKYGISFSACKLDDKSIKRRCEILNFRSGYSDISDPMKAMKLNEDLNFIQAFIEDGSLVYQWSISLEGGVTKKFIEKTFEKWAWVEKGIYLKLNE